MSWQTPSDFEHGLLADTERRWPEILPLARHLVLAQRIEPLLLRNLRLRFVAQAEAEIESLLWFSPLIEARDSREIRLHPGVARLLAEQLLDTIAGDQLEQLWQATCRLTQHWRAEEQMERDLRWFALMRESGQIQDGLQEILRRIRATQEQDQQLALARLVKRSLPVIAAPGQALDEIRWLSQYAALMLGDAGAWTQPGKPRAMPSWLAAKLPSRPAVARLGIELRQDATHGQILHLVSPDQSPHHIYFEQPLPAQLYVEPEQRSGRWYTVAEGSRIVIEPPAHELRLFTLEGRQWQVLPNALAETTDSNSGALATLVLAHVPEDAEQAREIAQWLQQQGLEIELLTDSRDPLEDNPAQGTAKVLRLWSQAAQRFWAASSPGDKQRLAVGALLRTEDVDLPASGAVGGQILDWPEWQRQIASGAAEALVENLRQWLAGGELQTSVAPKATPGHDPEDEIAQLLAEIENPETTPPRRLAIGDRLAELGDPRPGVGVVEIEVPVEDELAERVETAKPIEQTTPSYPPEIQSLLDEIDDPKTEPPRRLEIGDELDRLGDPRPGVGLRTDGLPDIDWVEIPGGEFIYGEKGERRELPSFWIARYPITNAQFQAFVDDGGYKTKDWWHGLERPKPAKSTWTQANRPRTEVDWYEAVAFCRWLNARLGLPDETLRLPMEQEWERAACGFDGLEYLWGSEYRSGHANVNEKNAQQGKWYLEQTTAVGLYPHGNSPDQVADLAGNVWEWCLNKYDKPDETRADTSGDRRVLRGGSWFYFPGFARAALRGPDLLPESRFGYWGFRVLSSFPISS